METVRGIPILEIVEHEKKPHKTKQGSFLRDKLSLNKQTLRFKPWGENLIFALLRSSGVLKTLPSYQPTPGYSIRHQGHESEEPLQFLVTITPKDTRAQYGLFVPSTRKSRAKSAVYIMME